MFKEIAISTQAGTRVGMGNTNLLLVVKIKNFISYVVKWNFNSTLTTRFNPKDPPEVLSKFKFGKKFWAILVKQNPVLCFPICLPIARAEALYCLLHQIQFLNII